MGFYQKTLCFSLKGHFSVFRLGKYGKGPSPLCVHSLTCFFVLQGQALGGLCLRPGPLASSPQVDAAEPAGEQSRAWGAACSGPAAPPVAAARSPQDPHVDQRHLGAADHQEYHSKKHQQGRPLLVLDSWARRWLWEARAPAPWQTPGIKPSVVVS